MVVKVTALGGVGEIGMNMYVYETETTAVIVDCGVSFADYSYPGIDFIIPDITYIRQIKEKVKGIILSHGHEDHIGAVPFLLKEIHAPVYSGRLTLAMLDAKLSEHRQPAEKHVVLPRTPFAVGDIIVTFYPVNHSVSDTYGVHLMADGFSALHISDFKIDFTPVASEPFAPADYTAIGKTGLTALFSDSTNVLSSGFTASERSIRSDLGDLFRSATGRVFFSTFASNVERLRQVVDIAISCGRKVVFEGSSIQKNIGIATRLGYLNLREDAVIDTRTANQMPDNEVLFFVTGSQGEPNSSLYRIAAGERKDLHVRKGDLFIFSSRVIPGNEKNVNSVINHIYRGGGKVAHYTSSKKLHVSGHASQEELKLLLHLVRPEWFVPVHGEAVHLSHHIDLAVSTGIVRRERTVFWNTGERLHFENGLLTAKDEVHCGKLYVDTRGGFVFGDEELKERKHLSRDGMVLVQAEFSLTGHLESPPRIRTVGFTLSDQTMFELRKNLSDNMMTLAGEVAEKPSAGPDYLKQLTKRFFRKAIDRRPVIVVLVGNDTL